MVLNNNTTSAGCDEEYQVEQQTDEQRGHILSELGMTKESINRDVQLLRAWLKKQPHLPVDDIDNAFLERLLVRCKNSVVRVQKRLESLYSVRTLLPEFYARRDPMAADVQQVFRILGVSSLPRLTSDCRQVHITRLLDPDVSKFNLEHLVKTIFMALDVVLRELPPTLGDVLIWDAQGYTFSHGLCVSPHLVRKSLMCATSTYPARLGACHILHPPSFADRVVNLIKQFLPEKIANRIHLHPSIESLYEHVPRDILPKEYGGTSQSVSKFEALWVKKLVSNRSWFLQSENVRVNDALRLVKPSTNLDMGGMEGSFRKLDID